MSDNSQPSTSASPLGDDENQDLIPTSSRNADQEVRACCFISLSTRKFASLAFIAFIFISAVIFLVAANVSTDPKGIQISRLPVYRYLSVVLVIAIIWMATFIFSKCCKGARTGCLASHTEAKKSLLPQHLLVGVMFFGLGSSFLTMVELLQYISELNCPSKDPTMMLYYIVRTIFIYTQLYFFYKLSRDQSEKLLLFGHFLVMHLIAVNLGTWVVTFVYDSAEELEENENKITNSTLLFMARHWGVDLVKSESSKTCLETVEALESTAKKMEPYLYTFTMEYCLISAGLMLNTWLQLRTSMETVHQNGNKMIETSHDTSACASRNNNHRVEYRGKAPKKGKYGSMRGMADSEGESSYEEIEHVKSGEEAGTLWRFGFILGLAYLPIFVAIIINLFFTDDKEQDQLIYLGMQFFFYLSILVASWKGICHVGKIHKIKSESQVDFILLAVSLVGVFFLDFLIIVAACCEMRDHPVVASFLIVTNVTELICSIMFTLFVRKALERELPENIDARDPAIHAASKIREVVSFLFMLNICFWGMYTFEVKKSVKVLDVVEQFYTEKVWFYLSHFVYPLAVFFHFHGAVCMFEALERYSMGKPSTRDHHASVSLSIQA